MKRKLLFAALLSCLVGGAKAQTDVTSTYMTDPSFEKNGNTTSDISSTGVIGSSDWNIITISHARVAFFNADSDVSTYGKTSPSDGTYYLMIRGNASEAKTQTIRQNSDMALPKGKYNISFDYKAARSVDATRNFSVSAVSSDAKTTFGKKQVSIPKVSANSSYFAGIDWSTETFDFTLENTTNVKINIACETKPSQTVVLFDNIVIRYSNINGDVLAALIAQATSINTAKGGLSDAISAAQSVYNGINNTIAYQTTIDDAITALKSAITTKVAGITMHHGDDLSYLIANAGFEGITAETENYSTVEGKDYSIYGWILNTTCDSGQGAVLTYGSDLTVNSATIPAIDNASNSGKALGLSVGWAGTQLYKTAPITLPAGKYNLKVYSYNAGTSTTLTSKFGFAPTSGDATLSTKTSYTKNEWGNEEVTIELASATEGCFQLGGVAASGGSDNTAKVFFDNITITYINELAEAQEQWQAVHDVLAGKDLTVLPTAAANAITDALALTVPTTTVDDVNDAKNALQALINSYDGIKTAYATVNAYIIEVETERDYSAGDKTALNAAIDKAKVDKEDCTTAAALTSTSGDPSVYSTLRTARRTYVKSGAEPFEGYPFDLTFKITNPSFEWNNTEGWSVPNKGSDYGVKPKGSMTNAAGNYIFNNWKSSWADLNIQQTVSDLPKGRYEVTAVLASYSGTQANLQAGGGSTDKWMGGENNGIRVSVNGYVTDGSITIIARAGRTNSQSLLKADDFTLSFIGYKPVLNNLITSATALTTANVGDGTFQIPTSAKTTLEGAIATAQAVLDDAEAYGTTIENAINDLNTAITNFQGATLNAPDEDDAYNLYLADGGSSYAHNLTFLNGNEYSGTYKMSFTTADAQPFYNQAVHFKHVSGNQYNLYIKEADGTKQYLCTGAGGEYTGGTTQQIRVTTDDTKALAVLLVASNTEDGIYYLKNTESTNALIGTSDGGFYTVTSKNKFNINPASTVSVGVNVKAGKWATRIFPFNPTLPAGVVAYTAEVNGNSLNLTEVASPAANVPYILKNTTENDVDENLSGYGTAKQDAYTTKTTSVDLTGIYTAASIPVGSYVLQTQSGAQGFYQTDAAITGVAYRVYLTVPGTAEAKAFYLDFDDTTGIDSMNGAIEGLLEGEVYDLSGRLVKNPTRGIYIVNGKKVLIK